MELGSEPQPRSLTCRAEPGEQRAPSTHLRKTTPPLTSLMPERVPQSSPALVAATVDRSPRFPSLHHPTHISRGSPCALTKPLRITPTLLGPTDISECTSPGKSNTPCNNATVCKVQPEAGLSQAT